MRIVPARAALPARPASIQWSAVEPDRAGSEAYPGSADKEKVMAKKKKTASAPGQSTARDLSSERQVRNNVRKLRQDRKWTQWQLAQISRLSQRTIQRIERDAKMGITAELALAGAFEVEIPEL